MRAASGTRFWDGSWWRRVSGAPVATPGTSDHGWGLAVDGAVRDPHSGQAVGVYRSAAWAWLREHLTQYGLCWAWADEGDEPWHWHLFEIGAPAVLAHEAGSPPPITTPEPSPRWSSLPPSRRSTRRSGGTGCTRSTRRRTCCTSGRPATPCATCRASASTRSSRFAAWFGAHEPDRLPDGNGNPRKLYLQAAADECATMAVNGHYDESVARAVAFVQHAFSDSNFGGRRVGPLDADGWVGRQQTWPFIDTLADGDWAA